MLGAGNNLGALEQATIAQQGTGVKGGNRTMNAETDHGDQNMGEEQ